MRILHPELWAWLLPLAVAVLLYLFRRRPKRVRVSTLPFFKSLAKVYQESAWLRRLKRLLSFLFTAIVLGGGGLALLGPVRAPEEGGVKSVVILVDASASMAAKDAEGRTRLEVGIAEARARLDSLPGGVGVLVIAYDRRPEILLPRSYDRRAMERALDAIEARPIEGDAEAALALAGRLAALATPAAIWHLTDGGSPIEVWEATEGSVTSTPGTGTGAATSTGTSTSTGTGTSTATGTGTGSSEALPDAIDEEADHGPERRVVRLPDGVRLEEIAVPLEAPRNAGITLFEVRPLPLSRGRFEAFCEVRGAAPEDADVEAELEVRLDDTLLTVRPLILKHGEPERLQIPIEGARGGVLTARLHAEGDALALDDVVPVVLEDPGPTRVLWVRESPDPFTQLALTAIAREGEVEVFEAGLDAWPPKDPVEVVLFDGVLPDVWPTGTPALVIDPPRSLGPIRAARLADGLPLPRLRAIESRHPLLFGVASERLALTQTAALEAGPGLAPLWAGPAGPLLLVGEARGQRVAVLAASPARSERLALTASFPLLLGNAVRWLAERPRTAGAASNHHTGALLEAEGATRVRWSPPAGEGEPVERAVSGRLVPLDRVGVFETDAGHRGAAALLSGAETRLPAGEPLAGEAGGAAGLLRGDLRDELLWLILLALLAELWLLHRFGVF